MLSLRAVSLFALLVAVGSALALAQGSGNIVCWKDKSGKTVGCGDKVPPEYQDNATREINKRGVAVKQSDATLTAEQKKAKQAEARSQTGGNSSGSRATAQGQGAARYVYHGQ